MRIGMIFSTPFPPREGIGFYVWNLARQLKNQGHHITLITRGDRRKTWCEVVDGIPVWRPSFLPVYPYHVHLHGLFIDELLSRLASDLDIIHLHTPLVKKPNLGLPQLVTVHSPIKADSASFVVQDLWTLLNKLQTPVSLAVEKDLLHHASRLVCVSKSVSKELEDYGFSNGSVGVIGNLTDTSVFFPREVGAQKINEQYVFTAGRLAPRKGLEDLIECARILKERGAKLKFLIAGEGPNFQNLQNTIRTKGLESTVTLLGHISDRNKLAELYCASKMYVHPAHYEGLPTVVLEAMACGKPVIATEVSGLPDVINNGINGFLTPPRNPGKLANFIEIILNDDQLADRIGQAARKTIQERFSLEVVTQNYIREYQNLLDGRD